MFAIIGSVIFVVIMVMTILVACGLPLGEFTMGGKHKILPNNLRIMAIVSVLIQAFAIVIVLQTGGFIPLMFSFTATKYICFFFATYLSLNTILNLASVSKKEKYVMSPLSFITAICYWLTAFQV